MGKKLTFLGDLEGRNKVSIFAPSISCGWRNKMPFFKVLHTYQINRCPKFLTATKAWGFFVFGDWHSAVIQGDILAAVSNPLQGCIKRCTETYRECDRGESNLDSHHERNETDEVLRPCWFAHSLKTDSRSVENNQTKETPAAVGEKFFLALLLKGLFVHVRIYDWLFSCLYIQYILYSKYKVKYII